MREGDHSDEHLEPPSPDTTRRAESVDVDTDGLLVFINVVFYVHRDRVETVRGGEPRTPTSTLTQFLSSELELNVA